jgi:ATP-dependent DNA ligase
MLGLYDDAGRLNHVGVTSSFTMAIRLALARELAPLRRHALASHPWRDDAPPPRDDGGRAQRLPGATSRWSAGKDLAWVALRPERVCEVRYDHLQGDRFRHATTFLRWRPDKPPEACRYDQLEVVPPYALRRIFGAAAQDG